MQLTDDLTLRLEADDKAETLDVELTYEGHGWLAFGSSISGSMLGSEVVIGLPDEPIISKTNPAKYFLLFRSPLGINPLSSEQQTLMNANVVQNDTHTVLTYTKLLEEKDEIRIFPEYLNKFVYAVGTSNTFGYHGQQRGFIEIEIDDHDHGHEESEDFSTGGSTETKNALGFSDRGDAWAYWVLHGLLMIVAWVIFVPIAIALNVFRDTLSLREDVQSRIQTCLNGLILICTCAGFAIAVYAVQKDSNIKDSHDEVSSIKNANSWRQWHDGLHASIGFIVTVLSVLLSGFAIFRTHSSVEDSVDVEEQKALVGYETKVKVTCECPEKSEATAVPGNPPVRKILPPFCGLVLLGLAWYCISSGMAMFIHRYGEE